MVAWILSCGRRIANLSFAGAWRAVREPRMTMVRLAAPPSSNVEAAPFLFPNRTPEVIEACRIQFAGNHVVFQELDRRFFETRRRRTIFESWWELLYLTVRLAEPLVIVETGVFDGPSSAVILQALEDNGKGRLISIDLPAVVTINGSTQCMPETCLAAGR